MKKRPLPALSTWWRETRGDRARNWRVANSSSEDEAHLKGTKCNADANVLCATVKPIKTAKLYYKLEFEWRRKSDRSRQGQAGTLSSSVWCFCVWVQDGTRSRHLSVSASVVALQEATPCPPSLKELAHHIIYLISGPCLLLSEHLSQFTLIYWLG